MSFFLLPSTKRYTAVKLKDAYSLAALFMPAVISCIEDQEKIETMFSGYMSGYTDSEGYVTVLKDDFGTEYMVSEKSDQLNPDTLYRLVASVALDENRTARILQMVPTISYLAKDYQPHARHCMLGTRAKSVSQTGPNVLSLKLRWNFPLV